MTLGAAIGARRGGVVDQVDATRIVIRATEDLSAEVRRRHLPADEVPAFEPEHLHQPASAGAHGRQGQQGRHHRGRSFDRPRRSGARPQRAGRVHAVERLQLRGTSSCSQRRSSTTSSPRSTSRNSRSWPATPSSGLRKSRATSLMSPKKRLKTSTRPASSISARKCSRATYWSARSRRKAKAR